MLGLLAAGLALVMTVVGGLALTVDRAGRDAAGYLTAASATVSSDGYALTSDSLQVRLGAGVDYPRGVLGDLRLRATATDPAVPIFVGVAPTVEVERYLAGVRHTEVTGLQDGDVTDLTVTGTAVPADPSAQTFWTARSEGTGTRSVTWVPREGDWTIVVMRADGSAAPSVSADIGADVPVLTWISGGVLAGGLLLMLLAGVLVVVPAVRAARTPRA